jgi:HAMP domain
VVAAASLYDGGTLVGEYDPRALNDALRQSTAHLLVVDPGLRTVLSNRGYQAFSGLLDPELRAAAAVGPAPVAAVRTVDGSDAAVAAQRIGVDGDPLAALGWVVLTYRDLGDGEFAHDPAERTAAAITGLSAGIVLALLGWTYIATVRPLRGAATHAAAIAAVRDGASLPAPLPAQRADEIGAITAGLNRHLYALTTAVGVPLPRASVMPPSAGPAPGRPSIAGVDRGVTGHGASGWELDDRDPDALDVDALVPLGE